MTSQLSSKLLLSMWQLSDHFFPPHRNNRVCLSWYFACLQVHNLLIWSIVESTRNGQHYMALFSHSPFVLWLGLSKLTCMACPQNSLSIVCERGCSNKTGCEADLLLSVTQQVLALMVLSLSVSAVESLRVEQNLPLSERVGWSLKESWKRTQRQDGICPRS